MQRVDYFLGIPLCFLATLWISLKRLLSPSPELPLARKILFIELSEMGSAIIAYQALLEASQQVGRENIYFLIFESNKESVEILNLLPPENIITIKSDSLLNFAISSLSTVIKLRRLQLSAVLDLELFSRCTALLSFLSGAPVRVGFHNFTEEGLYRGELHNRKVLYNPLQHMAQNFLALFYALNDTSREIPLLKRIIALPSYGDRSYQPKALEKEKAFRLLNDLGYPGKSEARLFIINPDPGALPLRGWPLQHYAELAARLLNQSDGNYVAVVGLSSSESYYQGIARTCQNKRLLNLTGKTSNLRELLAVLLESQCFITNDSGPAHMAAFLSISSITLFGPESPVRYKPLSHNSVALCAGLSCSPCVSAANHRRSACDNNVCMQSISVDEVFSRVLDLSSRSA